jgi:hypothetical protein
MVRGAADMQNKDWGITITWNYDNPPYLESAEEMYSHLLTAYETGAKYALIFDYPTYPEDNPYGVLTDEHFNALEQFWDDITDMSTESFGIIKADAALVLPTDYGWGMRHPHDKIWGAWGPDELSPVIWDISRALLAQYGYRLDIIYDDSHYPIGNRYEHVYYWNQTYSG